MANHPWAREIFIDNLGDTRTEGRQYQLAQPCDGSITGCALALFVRWCKETGHCPSALYKLSLHSLPGEGRKKSFRLTSSDVP